MTKLLNPSFEHGWTDLPPAPGNLINQRPRDWDIDILPIGATIWHGQAKVNCVPECVHKLARQLPPDEQPGQPGALILDGTVVYKVFKKAGVWGVQLKQAVAGLQPGSQVTFWINALLDLHQVADPHVCEVMVGLIEAAPWPEWHIAGDLGHRKWNQLLIAGTVPASGTVTAFMRMKCKADVPIDVFIDACSLVGIPAPDPEPTDVHDLARYILADSGRVVRLAYDIEGTKGQQMCQMQSHPHQPGVFLQVKDHQWRRLYLSGDWICTDADTSEGADRFYRPRTAGRFGATWIRRHCKVGDASQHRNEVHHYWRNCILRAQGMDTGTLSLNSVGPHTFESGITLPNVAELQWHVDGALVETYRYAPHLGLVGWQAAGRGKSWLHEILPVGQPPLEPETLGCIGPPQDLYEPGQVTPPPAIRAFSQRDDRWRHHLLGFSDEFTIGSAGCAVTCVAMLAALVEPSIDPGQLNERLKAVRAFDGAEIIWSKIPAAVPKLHLIASEEWIDYPAPMDVYRSYLIDGPVITLLDFKPSTSVLDSHFALATGEANGDLTIIDPWDGAATRVLQRYARDHWDLSRAVYGMCVVRPVGDQPAIPTVRILIQGAVDVIVERS